MSQHHPASPTLLVKAPQGGTRELEVSRTPFTIGRKHDNNLCLEDLAVSAHHARIVQVQQVLFLEDLTSTNGTFVNEQKIDRRQLRDADSIRLGTHRLIFREAHPITAETARHRRGPDYRQHDGGVAFDGRSPAGGAENRRSGNSLGKERAITVSPDETRVADRRTGRRRHHIDRVVCAENGRGDQSARRGIRGEPDREREAYPRERPSHSGGTRASQRRCGGSGRPHHAIFAARPEGESRRGLARIIHESPSRNHGDALRDGRVEPLGASPPAWVRASRSQACHSGVSVVAVGVIVNNAG
jgi:pSer/pThr/pTyr-binding forkhead associated (FHA) protein